MSSSPNSFIRAFSLALLIFMRRGLTFSVGAALAASVASDASGSPSNSSSMSDRSVSSRSSSLSLAFALLVALVAFFLAGLGLSSSPAALDFRAAGLTALVSVDLLAAKRRTLPVFSGSGVVSSGSGAVASGALAASVTSLDRADFLTTIVGAAGAAVFFPDMRTSWSGTDTWVVCAGPPRCNLSI